MAAVGGATVVAFVALSHAGSDPAPPPVTAASGSPGHPNILVLMTDDQTLSSYRPDVMPHVHAFFDRRGTTFEQAIAAPPLCCPARAGFLTGQYAHNHGVLSNDPGYPALKHKRLTLPVALKGAGYRTAMIGKYLNGYELKAHGTEVAEGPHPAPGFDRWFATYGPDNYFDFKVSDDGEQIWFRGPGQYSTDVFMRAATHFIQNAGDDGQPFFLWLTPNAPHTVASTDPLCPGSSAQARDASALESFEDEVAPRTPAFDEADVSDKPQWAQRRPLSRPDIAAIDARWRCQLAAMRAVDDGFQGLIDELRRSRELRRTVVVFVSDNGFFYGEHRRASDKRLPLEPALRVPLAISPPPGSVKDAGRSTDELVSTVDVAPTLLDYAGSGLCKGSNRCRTMDGRSLRPLLEADPGSWPDDRAIPLELEDSFTYTALRTPFALYSELTGLRGDPLSEPSVELYDLGSDPDELENLASSGDFATGVLREAMATRLRALRTCAGIEGRDERTGSRPFCE
jgi:N-acetylglucosamine-6-sulfatase